MLANANIIDLILLVAEAAAETSLEGGNMALAIFIPVLIISLLLGGAYIYLTRWGVQLGWGAGGRAPWGCGQGWLSIAVPLPATCPGHGPGEPGTKPLRQGPWGADGEPGWGGCGRMLCSGVLLCSPVTLASPPQVSVLLQPPPAPHVLPPLQPDHGRNGVRQPDL